MGIQIKYPASADDDLDALAEEVNVEKSADGEFVVRDVEPGYVYEVTVSWEYGDAQYGFYDFRDSVVSNRESSIARHRIFYQSRTVPKTVKNDL